MADAVGETIEDADFNPEWWQAVLIDYVLLGAFYAAGLGARDWFAGCYAKPRDPFAASRWYLVGGALGVLTLDVVYYGLLDSDSPLAGIALGWLYVPALLALLCFILGNPAELWTPGDDPEARWRAQSLLSAVPLVFAVGIAYTGQNLFGSEFDDVHQEYFAQMSQVIPLLLVALGLEGRYLKADIGADKVRWAITLYVVIALVIGEALAISALPVDNETWNQKLYPWHEYAAFSATLYAATVALAAVVIILLWGTGGEDETAG